jgi:hypothetical protein
LGFKYSTGFRGTVFIAMRQGSFTFFSQTRSQSIS